MSSLPLTSVVGGEFQGIFQCSAGHAGTDGADTSLARGGQEVDVPHHDLCRRLPGELPDALRVNEDLIVRDEAVLEDDLAGRAHPLPHLVFVPAHGEALGAVLHRKADHGLRRLLQVGIGVEDRPLGDMAHGDEHLSSVDHVTAVHLFGPGYDPAPVHKVHVFGIGSCDGLGDGERR